MKIFSKSATSKPPEVVSSLDRYTKIAWVVQE